MTLNAVSGGTTFVFLAVCSKSGRLEDVAQFFIVFVRLEDGRGRSQANYRPIMVGPTLTLVAFIHGAHCDSLCFMDLYIAY